MTTKKRQRGRPKIEQVRISCGFRFSQEAIDSLSSLVTRYNEQAPGYISLSQRAVLEALIDYAIRTELSFSELLPEPAKVVDE